MNAHGIEIKLICYADPCLIDDHVIERYPGNYDFYAPGGEFFFDVMEKIVLSNFLKGLERFKYLLRHSNTREITICYDALGVFKSNSGYASYCSNHEGSANGSHLFFVHPPLLVEYARNYWTKAPLRTDAEYVWEHELTHMLDHGNVKDIAPADECTDGRELFIEHLLKLRCEGIADLIFLFRSSLKHGSMVYAKRRFSDLMCGFIRMNRNTTKTADEIRNHLAKFDADFIGTWMILHILGCPVLNHPSFVLSRIIEYLNTGEFVGDLFINRLMSYSLTIDNQDFIRLITSPGIDGLPFVEESLLSEAAAVFSTLSIMPYPYEPFDDDDETRTENLADSKKLLDLFNHFWGNSHMEKPAVHCL